MRYFYNPFRLEIKIYIGVFVFCGCHTKLSQIDLKHEFASQLWRAEFELSTLGYAIGYLITLNTEIALFR